MENKRYQMTREELIPKGLLHPPVEFTQLDCHFDGIKIDNSFLHITDLHLGKYGAHSWLTVQEQTQLLEKIAGIAKKHNPRTILFTGDLTTNISEIPGDTSASEDLLNEILGPIKDLSIPKFAIPGNHDTSSSTVEPVLQQNGFISLAHGRKDPIIENLESNLSLWALPDFQTQWELHHEMCQNIYQFYAGVDPSVLPIILAHNPDSFDRLPLDLKYLGLAGHTHAGAYAHPFLKQNALKVLHLENKNQVEGAFPTPAGGLIYVSRGAGRHITTPASTIPMEVTLVKIS